MLSRPSLPSALRRRRDKAAVREEAGLRRRRHQPQRLDATDERDLTPSGPKNALILHGTGETPQHNWIPWLQNQLGWRGYDVWAPQLPDADTPDLDVWWAALKGFDYGARTVIVGHGSGATMALAILHKLPPNQKVRLVIAAAASYRASNVRDENLFTEEYDWHKVRRQVDHIELLWAPDDPEVLEEQTTTLANKLTVEPLLLPGQAHFDIASGSRFRRFPEVMELVGRHA